MIGGECACGDGDGRGAASGRGCEGRFRCQDDRTATSSNMSPNMSASPRRRCRLPHANRFLNIVDCGRHVARIQHGEGSRGCGKEAVFLLGQDSRASRHRKDFLEGEAVVGEGSGTVLTTI